MHAFLRPRTLTMLAGLGFGAGVLGGLLGIGGGALVVPGLVLLLNFNQHRAHGTSLVAVIALAGCGVATYSMHGNVNFPMAIEVAVGGVAGAVIGAKVANAIHARYLRRVFSIFIIFVGVRMILQSCAKVPVGGAEAADAMFAGGTVGWVLAVLGLGVLTGFASSLLGIGGGMVMVPALVILLCVPQKMAQGVSLAAMLPTAFAGMLTHRHLGNVDLRIGALVGLGAGVGAFAGASAAAALPTKTLQIVFGAFLLLMALLMALKKPADSTA